MVGFLLAAKVVVGLVLGAIDFYVGAIGSTATNRIHLTTLAGQLVRAVTIGSLSAGLLLSAIDPSWASKRRWALCVLLGTFLGGLILLGFIFK